jgi:hypothetical protein
MRKSMPRGRHGVIASSPRSNDPGCSRHQHPDFRLLSPQGPPAKVFLMTILDPDTQLCVSGDIFAEYEEVIRRARLNRSDSEIVIPAKRGSR